MQFTTAEIILLLLCLITLTVSIITLITVFKKNSNNKAEDELQKILLNQLSLMKCDRQLMKSFKKHLRKK